MLPPPSTSTGSDNRVVSETSTVPNAESSVSQVKGRLRLASWNVETLTGKSTELVKILQKRRVDIACLQDIKWEGTDNTAVRVIDGWRLWYSGSSGGKNGVAIIIGDELSEHVIGITRTSDRVMAVKFVFGSTILNVISAYAPEAGLVEEAKTGFWKDLGSLIKRIPKAQHFVIGGDFNGQIGRCRDGYEVVHGGFGLGDRNDNGVALLEFSTAFGCYISNSWFRKKEQHLATFRSPTCKTQNDYFLVRVVDKVRCRDCKVIPKEDLTTQHNLLLLDFELSGSKNKRKPKLQPRIKYKRNMEAKEINQVNTSTSGTLSEQCEFDVEKDIDKSSGLGKDEDGIFEMEDLGGQKGDKKLTDEEPSIRIIYRSLPRNSKRKLYELLNCWSEWHAKNCVSGKDPVEPVEDGEETYFPALHVGLDKSSTVSFWMDGEARKRQRTESLSVDDNSTPMYDRNYPLGMALDGESADKNSPLDLRDPLRCFNCGSYSHSLKECSKPYNNVAVNNARKEFQSKRNKTSGSHSRTRYYQDTPAGKYDGLKPGCLSAETRELLGLKELQPAPWLARMRQLGYPPGYLDSEEKDEPSGITIFGDEEVNDPKPESKWVRKKMSVAFPGINAPIPKNANLKDWETVQGLNSSEFSAPQPDKILNHIPPPPYNLHGLDQAWSQYEKPLSLNYRYESPPLHYNYESPHLPPLNFTRPNYFHDISPRGIPIPRSPGPHGFSSPHFMSRSPSFPDDRVFQNHDRPLPDLFMRQNSWHSPA